MKTNKLEKDINKLRVEVLNILSALGPAHASKKLNCTQGFVSNVLNGRRQPSTKKLIQMHEKLVS